MSAYWLTYKPLSPQSPRGWPAEKMDALVRRFEANPASARPPWRFASHRSGAVGDRIYLFKQGLDPRGIFGIGRIIEAPSLQIDPDDIDEEPKQRAQIFLERLVNPASDFLLGLQAIEEFVPENLISAQSSGTVVPNEVEVELERRLAPLITGLTTLGSEQADDLGFDADSVADERERSLRAIRIRRGQPAFRAALFAAYGGRCAMSGCGVPDVLEAAHITPYLGVLTNHVSNGLLLRTDLHTLFDCGLIAVNPESRTIVIAPSLEGSIYGNFAGRALRAPVDVANGPSKRNLAKRYGTYVDKCKRQLDVPQQY